MFVWTGRHAGEAVEVWDVHPKSMCRRSWSWQQAGFLIRISTSPSSIILVSVYSHTHINYVCLFMTKHINTSDSRRLSIICLRLNYFIPQSSASRPASDDMSDYFDLLLCTPASSGRTPFTWKVYIHKMGSDSNIPQDRLTAQGSFRSSRKLELFERRADTRLQTRDYFGKWQMVWVTGGTGLRQVSHDSLLYRLI